MAWLDTGGDPWGRQTDSLQILRAFVLGPTPIFIAHNLITSTHTSLDIDGVAATE
jgi:hypothetical protein